jgi:AAA+ ATPase superfamily predicted ATPase
MDYALIERIGKPDLFVGRKKELDFFLQWIDDIKEEKSQSTAILARRKMGKTALMERLFNITFFKNDGVIPFYYEIKEIKMWVGDFCVDFFLTLIHQYIAFKTRKTEYLNPEEKNNFEKVKKIAEGEGLKYLTG